MAMQDESSLNVYRDLKNVTDTARDEGLAEGLEQGLQQGRQEATVVIVRAMLASGESVEKISQYTGLSVAGIIVIQSGQA